VKKETISYPCREWNANTMIIQTVAYSQCGLSQELATRGISTTPYKMTDFLTSGDLKGQVRNSKNYGHILTYFMEQSPS
jgi:hypothetical protein